MAIQKRTIHVVSGLINSDPDQEFSFRTEESLNEAIQAKGELDKLNEVFDLLVLSFIDTLNETILKNIGSDRDKLISVLGLSLIDGLMANRLRDSNQPINYDTYVGNEQVITSMGIELMIMNLIDKMFKPKFEKKLVELGSGLKQNTYSVKTKTNSGIGCAINYSHDYNLDSSLTLKVRE